MVLGFVGIVIFSGASISLVLLPVDFIASSIIFLFTGSMNSAIDFGISFLLNAQIDLFRKEHWLIDTPLDGLDLIVNTALDWQFNFYGRLYLIITCGGVGLLLLGMHALLRMDEAENGEGDRLEFAIGGLASMIVWAPMAWFSWMGLLFAGLQKFF